MFPQTSSRKALLLFEFSFVCSRNALSIPLIPQGNVLLRIEFRSCMSLLLEQWSILYKLQNQLLLVVVDISKSDLEKK
jgi:hypothetical protein